MPPPTDPILSPEDLNNLNSRSDRIQIPKTMQGTLDSSGLATLLTNEQKRETLFKIIQAYANSKKDALEMYRPLPMVAAFHSCRDRIRVVSGSNRAGKTSLVVAEIAAIARGKDPFKKRHEKNLRLMAVGREETHIADPMFRKLAMPGAFQIIPDEETGLWRAVRPDPNNRKQTDPNDLARKAEWKPAPPFAVEGRDMKTRWSKKGLGIPKISEFKTGTDIKWHSSRAKPRLGIELDGAWTDEELENILWLPEIQSRLPDREGFLVCSYTPEASTPQYYELWKRYENHEPGVSGFHLTIEDNPYISAQAKIDFYNDLKNDPDKLAVKYYGIHSIVQRRIYPMYSREEHCIDSFEIPDDWMRLLILDPGRQFPAVLFLAVKPEEDEVHAYAELYLRNKSAEELAQAVKPIVGGHIFEDFVIDKKAGEQTPIGQSMRVSDHYAEEFAKLGLESRRHQSSEFTYGSPDVDARCNSVKRWFQHKLLKIHLSKCPMLDKQIQARYYSKKDPNKPEQRQVHDVLDCLEYGAAWFDGVVGKPEHPHGLFYFVPSEPVPLTEEEERNQTIYSAFQGLRDKISGKQQKRRIDISHKLMRELETRSANPSERASERSLGSGTAG